MTEHLNVDSAGAMKLRRAVATVVLVGLAALLVDHLSNMVCFLLDYPQYANDTRYLFDAIGTPLALAVLAAVAASGIVLRLWWARWLGQAIGVALLVAAHTFAGKEWDFPAAGMLLFFPPPLALLWALGGQPMRLLYEGRLSEQRTALRWQAAIGGLAERLRWGIILGFGTAAMLVWYLGDYGWAQEGFPSPRVLTGIVAAVLLLGMGLTMAQRTLGIWLMGLAALGALGIFVYTAGALVHVYGIESTSFPCGQAYYSYIQARTELAMIVTGLLPGIGAIAWAVVGCLRPRLSAPCTHTITD